MIKVNVVKKANYPVSAPKIKRKLREFLADSGIVTNSEVLVALVGKKEMLDLSSKYLKDKKVHNVLTFTESELKEKFKYPDKKAIFLGEIVVCFPKVVEDAKKEEKLIEEKVCELLEHGANHLLGRHH